MLTYQVENVTVLEPIIPSPWDDRGIRNDLEIDEFLNEINSQDQEDDEDVGPPDPTTVPVNVILLICSGYITNILTG